MLCSKKSFLVTWWEIKSSFGCHLFIKYVGLKIMLMFILYKLSIYGQNIVLKGHNSNGIICLGLI
jgi:hypothetical protein